jgi:hypothetical protein
MDSFNTLGVKFSYFDVFINDNGGRERFISKTTTHVKDEFVLSMTETIGDSLVNLLLASQTTSHYVGQASIFISHGIIIILTHNHNHSYL